MLQKPFMEEECYGRFCFSDDHSGPTETAFCITPSVCPTGTTHGSPPVSLFLLLIPLSSPYSE